MTVRSVIDLSTVVVSHLVCKNLDLHRFEQHKSKI